jgi:hypothetical protein
MRNFAIVCGSTFAKFFLTKVKVFLKTKKMKCEIGDSEILSSEKKNLSVRKKDKSQEKKNASVGKEMFENFLFSASGGKFEVKKNRVSGKKD